MRLSNPRVPPLDPEALRGEPREILDRSQMDGRTLNIFATLIHHQIERVTGSWIRCDHDCDGDVGLTDAIRALGYEVDEEEEATVSAEIRQEVLAGVTSGEISAGGSATHRSPSCSTSCTVTTAGPSTAPWGRDRTSTETASTTPPTSGRACSGATTCGSSCCQSAQSMPPDSVRDGLLRDLGGKGLDGKISPEEIEAVATYTLQHK